MYKEGDKVRIIAQRSCHQFKIGEEVELLKITDDDFYASNGTDWWVVGEDEIEPIKKEEIV
jgi:hypothetical protein